MRKCSLLVRAIVVGSKARICSVRPFAALLALALVNVSWHVDAASAQNKARFPDKAIDLIEPFGAGGFTDLASRILAEPWGSELGVGFNVLQRRGGGTEIGALYALERPADGYTLLTTTAQVHTWMTDGLSNRVNAEAFVPVGGWGQVQVGMMVNSANAKKGGWDTPEKFFAALKNPEKTILFGTVAGSPGHIQALMMFEALGLDPSKMKFVPFAGGGEVRTALAGGHIDAAPDPVPGYQTIKHHTDMLFVFGTTNRSPAESNNAPAWADISKAKLEFGGWTYTIFAPASLKNDFPDRYERLVNSLKTAVTSDAFKNRMEKASYGPAVQYSSPEQIAAAISATRERISAYRTLIKK